MLCVEHARRPFHASAVRVSLFYLRGVAPERSQEARTSIGARFPLGRVGRRSWCCWSSPSPVGNGDRAAGQAVRTSNLNKVRNRNPRDGKLPGRSISATAPKIKINLRSDWKIRNGGLSQFSLARLFPYANQFCPLPENAPAHFSCQATNLPACETAARDAQRAKLIVRPIVVNCDGWPKYILRNQKAVLAVRSRDKPRASFWRRTIFRRNQHQDGGGTGEPDADEDRSQ